MTSIADPTPTFKRVPLDALDHPVAYQRSFRRITSSTVAALFLSQLWYWTKRLPDDRNGWLYKTQAEMENETGLSRSEQETARKHLRAVGLVEEKREGIPAKLWFRIDIDRLVALLNDAYGPDEPETPGTPDKDATPPQTSMLDSRILDGANPADIHTEITTGNTSEIGAAAPLTPMTEKKNRRKPETPVPDRVSDAAVRWAREQGVPESVVAAESAKFLDHHAANDSRFRDWDRAFHKWVRNGIDWGRIVPLRDSRPAARTLSQDELRRHAISDWAYGVYPSGYEGRKAWEADARAGTLPQLDGSRA